MKKAVVVLACLFVPGLLHGFPFSAPCGGDPGAWTTNDAFGAVPVAEWDDLRTTGVGARVPLVGPIRLQAGWEMLTWRAGGTRIDAAGALVGADGLGLDLGPVRLFVSPSAGFCVFGNLLGTGVQEGFHGGIGVARCVPQTYDAFSGAAFTVDVAAGAAFTEWQSFEPQISCRVDGDLPGAWMAAAGAGCVIRGRNVAGTFRVDWRWHGETGLSPTLDATARGNTGLVFGSELRVSGLSSSLEYNVSRGISSGSLGVGFCAHGDDGLSRTPAALEVFFNLGPIGPGRRALTPIGDERIRAYVSTAMGWWCMPASAATALRSCDYGAGLEARLLMPVGCLEADLGCAAGPCFSVVTDQSTGAGVSRILDTALVIDARIEPTLRIGWKQSEAGEGAIVSGIGVAAIIRTPSWVLVPFAASVFTDRAPVALRIFFFSEAR